MTKEEIKEMNDKIDFAYCVGVLNVSGIDSLSKELDRLKKIGKKPHDIFNFIQ